MVDVAGYKRSSQGLRPTKLIINTWDINKTIF